MSRPRWTKAEPPGTPLPMQPGTREAEPRTAATRGRRTRARPRPWTPPRRRTPPDRMMLPCRGLHPDHPSCPLSHHPPLHLHVFKDGKPLDRFDLAGLGENLDLGVRFTDWLVGIVTATGQAISSREEGCHRSTCLTFCISSREEGCHRSTCLTFCLSSREEGCHRSICLTFCISSREVACHRSTCLTFCLSSREEGCHRSTCLTPVEYAGSTPDLLPAEPCRPWVLSFPVELRFSLAVTVLP